MGIQAGDPVGPQDIDLFQFQKQDGAVWLIRPNLKYRWDPKDPLALTSSRSFPKAILGSYRIEKTQPDKKFYLVNLTSLFYGEVFKLSELVNDGGGTYALDREKCLVGKVKSFADNSIVQMQASLPFAQGARSEPVACPIGAHPDIATRRRTQPALDCRLQPLVAKGYRLYAAVDGRPSGILHHGLLQCGQVLTTPNRKERYVNRFGLKKKDPTVKLSEPIKPIVWVLDSSIPEKYRQVVRDGILLWNEAYEALGYKNAVQVIDEPKDPDYDHADGRYNVIRWIINPEVANAYAIAQFRTDPLTGEILNACVSVDANYVTAAFEQHKSLADYLETAHPADGALAGQLKRHGWSKLDCSLASGLLESARSTWITLNGRRGKG